MERQHDDEAHDPTDPSDAELLHLWRVGLVEAGTALMRRHEHAVRRFFRHRFEDATEDLVQQTFLLCMQAIDRILEAEKFAPFLMGIARRVAFAHMRTREARVLRDEALGHEPQKLRETPSREYVLHQQEFHLMRAIERLPPDWQLAVVLHYWQGLSVAEVARVQGVSEGAVKSRLARSRARLKRRLAVLLPDLPIA